MKFHIPFTYSSIDKLKKKSVFLRLPIKTKKDSTLQHYLENSDVPLTREEYLTICFKSFLSAFVVLYVVCSTLLVLFAIDTPFLFALIPSFLFALFVYISQMVYPRIYSSRIQRDIDRNLIPALEGMLVQLNSGVPLFSILVNVSSSDYGALTVEFKKAVRKINAGYPEIEVLEELGEKNPSPFFRRTLWQISNGMRAGSDVAIVIRESIKSLGQEQLLQVQTYGNKLNPLIMFYMLISVILPALSVTFLTIVSSLVSLPGTMTQLLFISVFVFVVLIQVMFLGIIKSLRPSLL